MKRTMTLEQARRRFLRTHAFRQSPDDPQQIEYRSCLLNEDWKPYAFYQTVELANQKFAKLRIEQKMAS